MAATSEDISSFISQNLNNPQAIADAAAQFNVSASDIQAATGYTPEQQASYFQSANIAPTYSGLNFSAPSGETSSNFSAPDQGAISSFISQNLNNPQAIADAASKFNVSAEDIQKATGFTPQQQASYFQSANITPKYSGLDFPEEVVQNAFKTIGMEGIGSEMGQINPEHYNYFLDQLKSGAMSPEQFEKTFKQNVRSYIEEKPEDPYSKYALSKIGDITQYAPKTVQTRFGDTNTDVLLRLASQIVPNLGELKGGIYGTRGESVGFGFDEATRILGREPKAVEQVILDMARNLMNQGVTDLNQLKVKDIYEDVNLQPTYDDFGKITGYSYNVYDPRTDNYIQKQLTPEQLKSVKEKTVDFGEGPVTTKTANIATQKALYAADKLLTQGALDTLQYSLGNTYSGPGMTGYSLVVNPTTGQPQFTTYGSDTGQGNLISAALTFASFIPGVAPFAQAASGLWALEQKNYLGAAAALAGAGAGLTGDKALAGNLSNISSGFRAADAIQRKDPLALAAAFMSNKAIAGDVGGTKLGNTNFTIGDVANAGALVAAYQSGNVAAMMNAAVGLAKSMDSKTASTGRQISDAINSGDTKLAESLLPQLNDVIASSDKMLDPTTIKSIATNMVDANLAASGYDNVWSHVYNQGIQNGMTEDQATNLAQSVAGVVDYPTQTQQVSATKELPPVVVSPETEGKDVYYPGDETELYRIDENYNIIEKSTGEIVGVVGENVRGTVEPKKIDITGTAESTPQEGNTATSFLDRLSNLRSIFSVGTPPAVGSGYSLFGSGASGTGDDEFVLIARDDPKQAIVWLENKVQEITNNPQTTEEQKVQIAQEAEKLKTEIQKSAIEPTPQTSTAGGGGGGGGIAPSDLQSMVDAGRAVQNPDQTYTVTYDDGSSETFSPSGEQVSYTTTPQEQEQTQTQLPVLTSPEGTWTVPEATSQVATPGITSKDIVDFLNANPGLSDREIVSAMQAYNITPQQLAEAAGMSTEDVQARYDAVLSTMNAEPSGGTETAGYPTESGTGGGTGGGEGTGTGTGTGEGSGAGTGTGEGGGTGGGYGTGTGTGAGTTTTTTTPKLPTLPKTIPQMLAANQMMREWELPKPREIPYTPDVKLFQDMYEFAMAPIPQSQPQLAQLVQEQFFDYIDEKKKKDEEERKKQESIFYYGMEEEPQAAKEGGLIGHNPEFYSEGGTSVLANRYVRGGGDGTSDSVPAMLASGEFVIPADVVSSLGNGDNEAGAHTLDKFMEVIREHKRSAHPSELPEDSKGPLAYLQEALVKSKGRKHGRTK